MLSLTICITLNFISREYPEQARFQSNITIQGSFLVASMLGSIHEVTILPIKVLVVSI